MFGLSEKDWKTIEALLVAPLKAEGCRIFVYGSRARGTHRKFSDLDVGFDGAVDEAKLLAIRSQLEESAVPVKVDLVQLADLPESFQDQVNREKLEI